MNRINKYHYKRYIQSQNKMSSLYKHIIPTKRLSTASTNDDFIIESKKERLGSLDRNDHEELLYVHIKKHKSVSFRENLFIFYNDKFNSHL